MTIIHEAMHAGNSDLTEHGYIEIEHDTFVGLETALKPTNAAQFEVVPRRILGAAFQFAGETFTPAGSSAAAPPLTPAPAGLLIGRRAVCPRLDPLALDNAAYGGPEAGSGAAAQM